MLGHLPFSHGSAKRLCLTPTSNLEEDRGTTLSLVSILRPVQHGWPYQDLKTPADVPLWVIETHKLFHHSKVDIKYSDLCEIVHLSLDLISSCLLPGAEGRKGQLTLSF